jgi:hypothetical protein
LPAGAIELPAADIAATALPDEDLPAAENGPTAEDQQTTTHLKPAENLPAAKYHSAALAAASSAAAAIAVAIAAAAAAAAVTATEATIDLLAAVTAKEATIDLLAAAAAAAAAAPTEADLKTAADLPAADEDRPATTLPHLPTPSSNNNIPDAENVRGAKTFK